MHDAIWKGVTATDAMKRRTTPRGHASGAERRHGCPSKYASDS
jgi:hypothetical protein